MTRIAKKSALKVTTSKFKHACLILDHGCLVAQANNEKGHAEQIALNIKVRKGIRDEPWPNHVSLKSTKAVSGEFEGCTLISVRIKKNGLFGSSKPCDRCEIAIKLAKIRKVIYFENDSWVEEYR